MRTLCWGLGLMTIGLGSAAAAQSAPAPGPEVAIVTGQASERPAASMPRELALDELSTLNGRQGPATTSIALSEQDLTAVNHGATITAGTVGSGEISIDRSAFAGFAGVGNFVINSGHNNNLQGALTINIVGQ